MEGCELCRRDGELSELYCHDCGKWICTVCGTVVHFAMKGTGDHDIIRTTTERDQLVHGLRTLAKRVTTELKICDVNANTCQTALGTLRKDNVTSPLDASSKA